MRNKPNRIDWQLADGFYQISLKNIAHPAGFEPATCGLEGRCSSTELWMLNGPTRI